MNDFVLSVTKEKAKQIYQDRLPGYKDVVNLEAHLEELYQIKSTIMLDSRFNVLKKLIDYLQEHSESVFDNILHGHYIELTINLKKTLRVSDAILKAWRSLVDSRNQLDADIKIGKTMQALQSLVNRIF